MTDKKVNLPPADLGLDKASGKPKAYPFEIEIIKTEGTPAVRGLVLMLTDKGFLMRTQGEHHFKVGDNHQARFAIPFTQAFVNAPVKVIKTYDGIDVKQGKELVKHFTVEMHFRELPDGKREEILQFTKAIGQK